MASRYTSYDSRSSTTSSHFSDPSSSTELNFTPPSSSRALVKSKPSNLSQLGKIKSKSNDCPNFNFTTMVKKFMDKKSTTSAAAALVKVKGSSRNRLAAPPGSGAPVGLVIPADVIAEDLKKTARKETSFTGLQKKLFGKEKEKKEVKALTDVKMNGNTRTLAMVLRSERELLSANKEQEMEIAELKLILANKNKEVEKLKDLCLKQREEIKSLKSTILFPDVMNSQLQELLEKQGSELKEAKQLIPTLQKQVSSLNGQLQCLIEDLAEVKADKYARPYVQYHSSSPGTPSYDHEEVANSLEFSSCDGATPGSPEDMFIKDLNPCLTPYCAKTKSKEFESLRYDYAAEESTSKNNGVMCNVLTLNSHLRKLSKSSNGYRSSNRGSVMVRAARRSDESKVTYGYQRLF